jgi:hypothetical protein
MKKDRDIIQELKELSPTLAENRVDSPFSLPAGYFSNFADSLLEKIRDIIDSDQVKKEHSAGLIPDPGRSMPYTVPAGYFKTFPAAVLSLVNNEENAGAELERLSPLLSRMDKKQPFEIPAGYFEQLKFNPATPQTSQKAPVIRLNPYRNRTYWAAAAVLTGFIALATWFSFNRDSQTGNGSDPMAENVETRSPDTLRISDAAIEDFLVSGTGEWPDLPADSVGILQEDNGLALVEINEGNISQFLSQLPDDAVSQYLADDPGSGNSQLTN